MLGIHFDAPPRESVWMPDAAAAAADYVSSVHGLARQAGLNSRRATELTDSVRDRITEIAERAPGGVVYVADVREILAKAGPPADCVARHLREPAGELCALGEYEPSYSAQEHPA